MLKSSRILSIACFMFFSEWSYPWFGDPRSVNIQVLDGTYIFELFIFCGFHHPPLHSNNIETMSGNTCANYLIKIVHLTLRIMGL